jgi:hypothetical protein
MTPEDLDQIRGVVERVVEEKQTVNRGDLGRAMEAVADEFSEVRKEMNTRFEGLDRRTERIEINVNSILMQTAGMSKSLTDAERL